MKTLRFVLVAAILMAGPAGCGPADTDGRPETAAAHDVSLPNGIESYFPLPADAAVRTTTEYEQDTQAIFHLPMPMAEAVAFYEQGFAEHGWTQVTASPELSGDGMRWEARGHGVELIYELTAPMGDAGPLTGNLRVTRQR